MTRDHRDLVIEMLADSECELRAHRDRLIDIIADQAFENFLLRRLVLARLRDFHQERKRTESLREEIRRYTASAVSGRTAA